jgi:dTDP-4-dehydrorhamnose reductase
LVFFISAEKYKAQLLNGHYAKALAHAASPIGVLLVFSLLLWSVSNLNP